jgi:hypothetical protein
MADADWSLTLGSIQEVSRATVCILLYLNYNAALSIHLRNHEASTSRKSRLYTMQLQTRVVRRLDKLVRGHPHHGCDVTSTRLFGCTRLSVRCNTTPTRQRRTLDEVSHRDASNTSAPCWRCGLVWMSKVFDENASATSKLVRPASVITHNMSFETELSGSVSRVMNSSSAFNLLKTFCGQSTRSKSTTWPTAGGFKKGDRSCTE